MRHVLLILAACLLLAGPASAANILIVNLDGPAEGFNDPTPVAPVGGNPGTTLGQQRLNVFQHAAGIWGAQLPSAVTIRMQARFNPQSCDASSAVLGSAGPIEVERDFAGAEFPGTWYHIALANKQAGLDLSGSDDISITFNSSIDNNDNCLAGTNWYLGLDGNEGSDIELLPVVLHEMGHGLGFSTLVNDATGEEFLGFPDLFETFILDNSTGLHWDDMTNGQRAASAVNPGNVVWDGYATTFAAPSVLGGTPKMFVNPPTSLPSTIQIGVASYGPQLTNIGVSGDVVLVDDGSGSDACEPILNAAEVVGRIALIDRGTCAFVSKTQAAQAAGAIAVIIANNQTTGAIGLGGADPGGLTIPTVSVSLDDGNAIKAALGGGVNVTLALDPAELAGADANNRVKLYTPNPVESGSSVSHFDTSANPSLLMEPAISGSLSGDVDLTLKHFEDIGWLDARLTASPAVAMARSALDQNSPNPFNPLTTIRFSVDRAGPVSLEVFDLQGRRVRTLVQEQMPAGLQSVTWNGQDADGRPVASGVYLYRLQLQGFEETRRMLLLK